MRGYFYDATDKCYRRDLTNGAIGVREVLQILNAHDALLAALQGALATAIFEKHADRPWHAEARAAIKQAIGE